MIVLKILGNAVIEILKIVEQIIKIGVIKDILKITFVSILMAVIVRFGVWGLMADITVYSLPLRILALGLLIFIGGIFYITGLFVTRTITINEFKNMIKR